jgi:hypothetical protein
MCFVLLHPYSLFRNKTTIVTEQDWMSLLCGVHYRLKGNALCGGYVHLSVTSMSPEIIRFLKILHMRFSVNSSGISDCQAH